MIPTYLSPLFIQVISKSRLTELVREVDPSEQLDEEVEDALLAIADDFIESSVNAACRLAKHRGSRTLDSRDLHMYLGKILIFKVKRIVAPRKSLSILRKLGRNI